MFSPWKLIGSMGVLNFKFKILVLFFENLFFNVNLFKVFVFKDINIPKKIFFLF